MSDMFSGRSGFFVLLLAVLIMVVAVGVEYLRMTSITPGKVSSELDAVYERVQHVTPLSVLKAQFLMEWGNYRNSDECSDAVAASRFYSGDGFEGNVYVVTYVDSIEFPGVMPTISRSFRVTKRIGD